MSTTRFTGSGTPARPRVARESRSEREEFLARLRRLGATDEELAGVGEAWADPNGWIVARRMMTRLTDADLRAMIDNSREEYRLGTTTLEEEAAAWQRAAFAAADLAWETLPPAPRVDEVVGWVGGDAIRARVALEHELARPEQRVTVLRFVEPLAAGTERPEEVEVASAAPLDDLAGIEL